MISSINILALTMFLIMVSLLIVADSNSAFATISKTETKIITEERDGNAVIKIETETDADIDVNDDEIDQGKVITTITDPIDSDGNEEAREQNREIREKIQESKDQLDVLDENLRDNPNSEPSDEVQEKVDDIQADATVACIEQDAPCSEPQ